jgi:ribosomal protein S21
VENSCRRKIMANKVINVEVSLSEVRRDQNKLIRKFIKKCKKERILEDYLDRRFYVKPSVRRRREKLKKLRNIKKLEAERKPKTR